MGYSYDYGYGYSGPNDAMTEEMMEMIGGIGMAFVSLFAVILLAALAVGAATYVFRSIGLYTIAKRRGIPNAWMAWVPVLFTWIVGSISDQYQYVVRGKVKNKRTLLLVLYSAMILVSISANVLSIMSGFSASAEDTMLASVFVLGIVNLVLGLVCAVFYYIAMYSLYTSCSPQNNVLFLVLSILFQITEPFFVFFNRNKDDGMPPRKEAPQVCIPEPVPKPWEDHSL